MVNIFRENCSYFPGLFNEAVLLLNVRCIYISYRVTTPYRGFGPDDTGNFSYQSTSQ
jgi:hypothetical protein